MKLDENGVPIDPEKTTDAQIAAHIGGVGSASRRLEPAGPSHRDGVIFRTGVAFGALNVEKSLPMTDEVRAVTKCSLYRTSFDRVREALQYDSLDDLMRLNEITVVLKEIFLFKSMRPE